MIENLRKVTPQMIKKLKKLLSMLSIATLLAIPAMPLATVAVVHADDITTGLNCGAELDAKSVGSTATPCASTDPTLPGDRVNNIIHIVINIFSLIVGVVSVIMIIIGGLKYITSGGDSGNITGAKNTILYAIIGLVVVALAQVVVKFVLSKVV
jgi:hypothetical protein